MKSFYFCSIISAFLFYACNSSTNPQIKQQDSLVNVLKYQVSELKNLPNIDKISFQKMDSLSLKDSLFIQYLQVNYQNAINTMDSIRLIFPKVFSESDTILKYSSVQDTSIIRRLNYLTQLNKNYISEYYKALGISEAYKNTFNQYYSLQQTTSNETNTIVNKHKN
jgi:PBP1b-binding outer membrane lipoprotein LpoB